LPYWQLFYHIVWGIKNREPLLTPEVEAMVYRLIRNKALDLGATIYALNGYQDHVHLVASVPPKISLSKFIGQVKAVSSKRINDERIIEGPFFWQEDYGVFSFDKKRLPNIVDYVEKQKEHHTGNDLIAVLERIGLDLND
jgi:REP element-mobilizing transposase RayT